MMWVLTEFTVNIILHHHLFYSSSILFLSILLYCSRSFPGSYAG
uniref:Uncharacterized protein n=1 Tax=Arundo donax TaxID=35708 RepID=A0A0A9G3G0_ARUDO